jgi:cytochrome c551/c552
MKPKIKTFQLMKKSIIISSFFVSALLITSCGGEEKKETESQTPTATEEPKSMVQSPNEYDPKRGEGKFTADNVGITDKLDPALATDGESIAGVKCFSCHKTTEEKLVGPGWKGVTSRHAPEWIMNFITNPDPMLNKDPQAQAMLEICLVRMPNQNLSDDEARKILEFMRKNDGIK